MAGTGPKKGIRALLPTLADLSAISPPIPGSSEVSRCERVTIPEALLDSGWATIEASSSVSIASGSLSGLEVILSSCINGNLSFVSCPTLGYFEQLTVGRVVWVSGMPLGVSGPL